MNSTRMMYRAIAGLFQLAVVLLIPTLILPAEMRAQATPSVPTGQLPDRPIPNQYAAAQEPILTVKRIDVPDTGRQRSSVRVRVYFHLDRKLGSSSVLKSELKLDRGLALNGNTLYHRDGKCGEACLANGVLEPGEYVAIFNVKIQKAASVGTHAFAGRLGVRDIDSSIVAFKGDIYIAQSERENSPWNLFWEVPLIAAITPFVAVLLVLCAVDSEACAF